MSKLYYVLTVWNVEDGRATSFRMKSNLSFPSPFGTRIHINSGNSFYAEVADCVHMQEKSGDRGEFHMVLTSTDDRHFAEDADEHSITGRFPHLTVEEYRDICETLVKCGWEEFESIWQ